MFKEFKVKKITVLKGKYYYADDGCESCLGSAIKWGHRVLQGRFDNLKKKRKERLYEKRTGDRTCGDKSVQIRGFRMSDSALYIYR